jgi:hypothetical protein
MPNLATAGGAVPDATEFPDYCRIFAKIAPYCADFGSFLLPCSAIDNPAYFSRA